MKRRTSCHHHSRAPVAANVRFLVRPTLRSDPWRQLLVASLLPLFPLMTYSQMPTPNPKQEVESLLDAVMPFAKQMLEKHGEFFPFGASMASDGKVSMVAAYEGSERPPSQALIETLTQGFRSDAKAGKLRATAIAYDARVLPPGKSEKVDAVVVRLDHRDNYSVEVVFPYSIGRNKKPQFGETFASKGSNGIFR